MTDKSEIRMILIGKSGSGKSATGNVLLGGQAFESTNTPKSVTSKCSIKSGRWHGFDTYVVDTPGLYDTSQNEEGKIRQEVKTSLMYTYPGPHVFLLCVPMNHVEENDNNLEHDYGQIFGKKMFNNTIIVFTMVLDWIRDRELQRKDQAVGNFIRTTLPPTMRNFLAKYKMTHHFLGWDSNEDLFDKIRQIQTSSSAYKNKLTTFIDNGLQEEEDA